MSETSTREQIVEAADQLFYRQGYEYTTFADIAGAVKISRGNFYFHFKTKDEILDAVIELRAARTEALLAGWEEAADGPAACIRSFINMVVMNREKIRKFGCPVGTLCMELAKVGHAAHGDAGKLFTLFRVWLRRQFGALGRAADADELAMHLLARSQGIATLASAFRDEAFIRHEAEVLSDWLDAVVAETAPTGRAKVRA
jgi:TetR/AcrR family transcriptional repressor of nem operon